MAPACPSRHLAPGPAPPRSRSGPPGSEPPLRGDAARKWGWGGPEELFPQQPDFPGQTSFICTINAKVHFPVQPQGQVRAALEMLTLSLVIPEPGLGNRLWKPRSHCGPAGNAVCADRPSSSRLSPGLSGRPEATALGLWGLPAGPPGPAAQV